MRKKSISKVSDRFANPYALGLGVVLESFGHSRSCTISSFVWFLAAGFLWNNLDI